MIARPAMASLGCRSCQASLFRAVLAAGRPGIAASAHRLQSRPSPSLPVQPRTLSTTTRRLRVDENIPKAVDEQTTDTNQSEQQDTPWFLDEELPQPPPSHHQQTLPVAPEGAPAVVEPMMKYIFEDMGLDDLALFDLRELDPNAALGPNLIMVFGTARSEKHLHVSAGRFVRWIRRHHQFEARADGLIGAGELRTKLRRLRKKAKLMGTNANIVPRGDHGISTGWICVSFSTDDGAATADANFDAAGRVSGFDAGAAGTTIVVQCMTEARRQELDLETLWEGMLKRSFRDGRQIRGQEPLSADELKDQVAARLQLPEGYNKAAKQWQAMEDASQKRYFSTSARRLTVETSTDDAAQTTHLNLDSVAAHVQDFQASGAPMAAEDLVRLVQHVFQAGPHDPDTAAERIRLVDQLLLAGEERGVAVLSGDVLITLVEALVRSPAYGPDLQRAQANIEFLLAERRVAPTPSQSARLMAAYAARRDWARFWDAFGAPARFRLPRGPPLYELAYAAAAAARDPALCTDALRRLYQEMRREDPPVRPTGAVYDALRACVRVADPAAEELLRSPPPEESMTTLEKRSLKHREFVVLLRDVERIRKELRTEEARLERQQALDAEIRNRFET